MGYNVVQLNPRSREVLSILEDTRIRFYIDHFREDYEAADEFLRTSKRPCTRGQLHEYRKLAGFVANFRAVYEQTAGLSPQHDEYGWAYVSIRSRFFRAHNRRFHAADFWPEHVPGFFRKRWFGVDTSPLYAWMTAEPHEDFDEEAREQIVALPTYQFVEQDISSSQTQIVAVFLGLRDLEALAGSREPKFKEYLAEQLWILHERASRCLCGADCSMLRDGYTGADDDRLVAFVKEHWMRRNYGGKVSQIVRELAREPGTYGPGWNCDVFTTGGVTKAEEFVDRFYGSLPLWSAAVGKFLDACACLGERADPYRGVVFADPFDGAEVRWNPVERATKKIPFGPYKIEARLRGRLVKKKFRALPPNSAGGFCVNSRELAQLVAPCLVHMLDAYFNALVLEDLYASDVDHVVAVHDGWFVPETVDDGDGAELLEDVIAFVGWEWLSGHTPRLSTPDSYRFNVPPDATRPGLGAIYDQFVTALAGSPYEDFALAIRARWRERVAAGQWPRFTASWRPH